MSGSDSKIKGPSSLQVQSLMTLYWNLSPKDQMHILQILEDRSSRLKVLYSYHKVDILLAEWNLFFNEDLCWKVNEQCINRWKQIRPYIKGFTPNESGLAICFTPELIKIPFSEELWEIVLEKVPKLDYQLMVEYNGFVKNLTDFLLDGPFNIYDKYPLTFNQWNNNYEDETGDRDTDDDYDVIEFKPESSTFKDLKFLVSKSDNNDSDDSTDLFPMFTDKKNINWNKFIEFITI